MKISLITATYNSEAVIRSCLKTVADQNLDTVEHIIVDGQSTDATVQIIKEFAAAHSYVKWISEPDQGSTMPSIKE
jgi:glycosyltransferase involved in cell wall biosynthesis